MYRQWSPLRLTTVEKPSIAIALGLLAAYVVGTLFLGLHHEPWRDEADTWLVVRDLPFPSVFTWTRNSGTPGLWFVALKPLISLGFPYQSQTILHLAFAWAAAAVLLFRAPFTWTIKVLALASYYFSFEYAIIARSYVLTILLSFVIASLYPHRHSRPIRYAVAIALLFNTNVHGGVIAAVMLVLFVFDRGKALSPAAVAIMIGGAIVAWVQIRTAPDAPFPDIVRFVRPISAWHALANAFSPGVATSLSGTGALVLIVSVAASLRRRIDAMILLLLTVVLLNVIYVFIWFGGYRHAGLILVAVLLSIWIAGNIPQDAISSAAAVLLNIGLALSVTFAFGMARAEIAMDFSGSREMGEFIRLSGLARFPIAAHNLQQAEAVLPYIPGKQFWYAGVGRYGSYMKWNAEEEAGIRMPYPVAVRRAADHFSPHGKPWLMLLNRPMPDGAVPGMRLVYATRGTVFRMTDERYWLYLWTGR